MAHLVVFKMATVHLQVNVSQASHTHTHTQSGTVPVPQLGDKTHLKLE